MSLKYDSLITLKSRGVLPALGTLLICGLLLTGILLQGVPAHADDLQDAISTIASLYAQYANIFGAPFGPVQTGADITGTFYVQWYVNGLGIMAWTDGYTYFYNTGQWYPFGTIWRSGYTLASAMIYSVYNLNPSFFGTPTGNLQMSTDMYGTNYIQWFVNGTGIKAASDGFMYSYNGMWYSLKINWK